MLIVFLNSMRRTQLCWFIYLGEVVLFLLELKASPHSLLTKYQFCTVKVSYCNDDNGGGSDGGDGSDGGGGDGGGDGCGDDGGDDGGGDDSGDDDYNGGIQW